MGLKSRGDYHILPGGKSEAVCHLTEVDVRLAFSLGGVVEEEVLLQVLSATTHLQAGKEREQEEKWKDGKRGMRKYRARFLTFRILFSCVFMGYVQRI